MLQVKVVDTAKAWECGYSTTLPISTCFRIVGPLLLVCWQSWGQFRLSWRSDLLKDLRLPSRWTPNPTRGHGPVLKYEGFRPDDLRKTLHYPVSTSTFGKTTWEVQDKKESVTSRTSIHKRNMLTRNVKAKRYRTINNNFIAFRAQNRGPKICVEFQQGKK